jgi:abhydrolase domain-containing protein 17
MKFSRRSRTLSSGKSPSTLRKLLVGEFSWRRMLRSILFIYVCFMAFAWFRADSIIFATPASSSYQDTKRFIKISVTADERITAIYLPNPKATYTILYSHGNASDLGHNLGLIDRIYQAGFSVLAYDYRGHGTSDGFPSEQNAYQDVDGAYRYLTEQLQIPADKIIVQGRSLGGAMAIDVASKRPVAGLIIESSFTSAFRVLVPFPILPFEKFHSISKLPKVRCPILVLHGEADGTIPFSHGQQLYNATSNPKQHLWVPKAGHVDLNEVAGDAYGRALQDFQSLVERNPLG